jgi:AcrR family transcriptional regulator
MLQAAKQLFRERGYNATAFSDVLKLSGAPRGSIYFHFPDGKTQLAIEVAQLHADDQIEIIDRAADQSGTAAELVERYVDLGREGMIASQYSRGCAIAPLVIEGATTESDQLADISRRTFAEMIDRLAFHFTQYGVDPTAAHSLADAAVAAVEGAMITSRAGNTPTPYDAVKAALTGYATSLTPKPRRRRST